MASYYPPRLGAISQLRKLYPKFEILDDKEEDWLEHLNVARSRGKAPPKKKRTAAGELFWIIGLLWGRVLTEMQNRRSSRRRGRWGDEGWMDRVRNEDGKRRGGRKAGGVYWVYSKI